jgi:hypothetical protein
MPSSPQREDQRSLVVRKSAGATPATHAERQSASEKPYSIEADVKRAEAEMR